MGIMIKFSPKYSLHKVDEIGKGGQFLEDHYKDIKKDVLDRITTGKRNPIQPMHPSRPYPFRCVSHHPSLRERDGRNARTDHSCTAPARCMRLGNRAPCTPVSLHGVGRSRRGLVRPIRPFPLPSRRTPPVGRPAPVPARRCGRT